MTTTYKATPTSARRVDLIFHNAEGLSWEVDHATTGQLREVLAYFEARGE